MASFRLHDPCVGSCDVTGTDQSSSSPNFCALAPEHASSGARTSRTQPSGWKLSSDAMTSLLPASIAALGVGPMAFGAGRTRPGLVTFIDGFVLVTIGGLVLLEVAPEAMLYHDLWAIAFMLVGMMLPTLAERSFRLGVKQTHRAIMALALFGVAVHSALDGSALAETAADGSSLIGFGILLHQVPVSMMVWLVLSDRPRRITWFVLTMMAAATVAGYLAEPLMLRQLPTHASVWFAALIGGSLLHVIAHPAAAHTHSQNNAQPHSHGPSDQTGWPSGLGAMIGVLTVVVMHASHPETVDEPLISSIWTIFRTVALVSAPAVLFAHVVAGLAHSRSTERNAVQRAATAMKDRARVAMQYGLRDLVDRTAPWMLFALVSTSLVASTGLPAMQAFRAMVSRTWQPGVLNELAVAILALLFAASLLRRGARAFLGELRFSRTASR